MRMDRKQARESIERARVGRLATADAQARPHIVPVTFTVDGDTVVTAVDHKPKTTTELKRMRNIRENPRVALLVDHYEDDWSRLWWSRADGEATLTDTAERADLVDELAAKYRQYRQQPPAGTLIVIGIHRWSGWSSEEA
ncbi:PPOX class probable F420-dependent enzyme [Saccharopolyspora lacisalsi]|uniref:PPOX class probable F420-dependent enzyme n=1 Tax=Halosaccharopolyspora lacisalsi TaxID=1000566 RepID=A0A839DZX5_9PSEU|nr:TIGR03668 family PPOX class F420-dependent oxidoreductase [Halosaccharopolyspora lacisalsi]MBA8827064.1 PPOX class probable F420-dependent enzyme [Halosaccharopolyspora lacisalsi]